MKIIIQVEMTYLCEILTLLLRTVWMFAACVQIGETERRVL